MRHGASDRELLRLVEHWTGHRKPTTKARKSMKISLLIIAIIGAVFALSSCTFQVSPDGSKSGGVDPIGVARVIEAWSAK